MKKCKSCQKEIDKKATVCPYCRSKQVSKPVQVITGIIVVFVVLWVFGALFGGSKNSSSSQATTNSQGSAKKEVADQKPTVIEASTLANAFDANQVAAEKEWGGKLVQFSAEISNITDTGISFYNVATEKEYSGTQISCRVKDKEQLLPLKNGQVVTVKGVVGNQTIGVIGLDDCEVVK